MATATRGNHDLKGKTSGLVKDVQKETRPLQEFFTKFGNDWATSFAGLLAYSLLMAMLPIAIALLAILGLVLGNLDPSAMNNIISQVSHVFPGLASQQNVLQLASKQLTKNAGILSIIAVLLALFGGSRLFVAMENCLDIIYRVRPRPPIRQNIMAIAMLILFIILIPIMVLASSGPTLFFSLLRHTPLASVPGIGLIFNLGGILGAFIVAFILFEAIYFVVPNQKISFRNSWLGAVIAAVLLEIFLVLFPIYIARFMSGYAGPVGFAVILLLFFYYFATILLLGAEINAFFREGIKPIPNNLGTFVSTMAGSLNEDIPEVESEAHQNPRPTVSADRERIARTMQEGQKEQSRNAKKQKEVALSQGVTQQIDDNREQRKQAVTPSPALTAVGVVAGSALAFVVELLRLRGRMK